MIYYPRYVGDFQADTMALSMMEQGAYDRLLDHYYSTEAPIPAGYERAARICRAIEEEERKAVEHVLNGYFKAASDGWHNARADEEIALNRARVAAAHLGGKASAEARRNRSGNQTGNQNGNGRSTEPATEPSTEGASEPATEDQPKFNYPTTNNQQPTANSQNQIFPNPEGLGATSSVACPVQEVVKLYHQELPDNPRCAVVSKDRIGKIRQRWNEWRKAGKYADRASGLAFWQRFFHYVSESKFLTGRASALEGREPFIADIDFLFAPRSHVRIVEGKYHEAAA